MSFDARLERIARAFLPHPSQISQIDRELARCVAECERAGTEWRDIVRCHFEESYIAQLETLAGLERSG